MSEKVVWLRLSDDSMSEKEGGREGGCGIAEKEVGGFDEGIWILWCWC